MYTQTHIYHHAEQALHGHVAFDDTHHNPRPAVLVFHDWSGRNAFAIQQAEQLAHMGYIGFAVDLYGNGRVADTLEEKQDLMTPLASNREHLLERITASFTNLLAFPEVDTTRVAAIGFCFGGLCALDLARSDADLSAAVSFHGILNRADTQPITPIQTKILALHGYNDPMVPPEQVQAFCQEMTEAKADWQIDMYGKTQHAFTNPEANDEALGTIYSARASHRAFQAMTNFLKDAFENK
jgi:dienelactone hydrolase